MEKIDIPGNKNRIYIFDWDDNILHMPTKINMEAKQSDGSWSRVEMSTEEFAIHRDDTENYRWDLDGLNNFRDPIPFINDTRLALQDEKNLGPSFEKFKECLMHAHPFAIITARGHAPSVIVSGIHELFNTVFGVAEMLAIRFAILEKHETLTDYFNKQKI